MVAKPRRNMRRSTSSPSSAAAGFNTRFSQLAGESGFKTPLFFRLAGNNQGSSFSKAESRSANNSAYNDAGIATFLELPSVFVGPSRPRENVWLMKTV